MIVGTGVDSYVDQDRPAANHKGASKLRLNGTSGEQKHAYIYFARPFKLNVNVLSATLRVVLAADWAGSTTITVERVIEAWKESGINWNNRPGITSTHAATATVSSEGAGTEVEIDVTDLMQDVASGGKWHGLRLSVNSVSDRVLVSSEGRLKGRHPELEVEWSSAPQPPDQLAPSGTAAISKTKPLLVWRFRDDAGNKTQAYSQVQISTSADFSSPAYDSGKEANTDEDWDLSTADDPVFSALADDAVRYWRVRVWDGSDLVSPWSSIVSFTRKSKGSLSITNPDPAPDNQVEETTPPIAWDFTGRTQQAWGGVLYRVGAGGKRTKVAERARAKSSATEWEIPAGKIKSGETYVVAISVLDTIERQAMAGDPSYVTAERTFTYERSGVPAPVTALTAEPIGGMVKLTWERDTDPDYFSLSVNGKEVYDRLEVEDVFVSGDTYTFDYYLAEPRKLKTYEVEAVVSDAGKLKHSSGNATDTARTDPIGVWLADLEDSLGVLIAGKEKATMRIGEVGETYYPIASRTPLRIVEAITGYEGSFNGVLTDYGDVTALEYRDRFLELKGRGVELRLIVGDLNIPVVLGEVSCIPSPDGDLSYDVSFEFWQTDEFEDEFEVAGL